jgi:hypothetical protein
MAACALLAAVPAQALLPQSLNGWKWGRTGPLAIKIGDNVSSAWDPYYRNAAAQWSAAANIDFVRVTGTTSPSACAPVFGTVQVCNGNYGATGWLGYAYLWTSNNYIVEATVKLNDYYFSQPRYNTSAWRSLVACQEIGHTLGLAHADVNSSNANLGTCMDYTNDPAGTKGTNGKLANVRPNSTDLLHLNAIYAVPAGGQLPSTKSGRLMVAGEAYDLWGDHDFDARPVPEPGSWLLMIAGFGALGVVTRARRSRQLFAI